MSSLTFDQKTILGSPKLAHVLSHHSQDKQQNQNRRLRSSFSCYSTVRSEFLNEEHNYLKPKSQSVFRSNLSNSRAPVMSRRSMLNMKYICTECLEMVYPKMKRKIIKSTHFVAFALFITGCWPFCLLPYIIKSCKRNGYICPVCGGSIKIMKTF